MGTCLSARGHLPQPQQELARAPEPAPPSPGAQAEKQFQLRLRLLKLRERLSTGPYDVDELIRLVETGQIPADTLIPARSRCGDKRLLFVAIELSGLWRSQGVRSEKTTRLVTSLLAAGATVSILPGDEQSPLFAACQLDTCLIPVLVRAGANAEGTDLAGNNILHVCFGDGNGRRVRVDTRQLEEVAGTAAFRRLLLGRNLRGQSVLHAMVRSAQESTDIHDVLRTLASAERKELVRSRDVYGLSPLDELLGYTGGHRCDPERWRRSVLELFFQYGCDAESVATGRWLLVHGDTFQAVVDSRVVSAALLFRAAAASKLHVEKAEVLLEHAWKSLDLDTLHEADKTLAALQAPGGGILRQQCQAAIECGTALVRDLVTTREPRDLWNLIWAYLCRQ